MTIPYTPNLNLRRQTVFISSIINNGVVDTALKAERINAAIAADDVRDVVFDIPLDLTFARTAIVDDSETAVFRIPSNRRLIGSPGCPIDASAWSTTATTGQRRHLFRAEGEESDSVALTADLAYGRRTITVGSVRLAELVSYGLGVGALIRITSDRLWITGGTVGTEEQGEFLTVVDLDSDGFDILGASHDNYAVSDDARVHVVTPATGIILEGITAVGPGMLSDGGTPIEGDRMMHMILCSGLRLNDVSCTNFDNGNYFYSCPDGKATGFKCFAQTEGASTRAVNQYGLALVNACQDWVVDDATIVGNKHGLVQTESSLYPGVTRRCTFKNSTILGTWNFAVATHTNAEHMVTEGMNIEACSGGVEGGCRAFTSRKNTIRFQRYVAGEHGIGIACTEVPEDFLSEGDRVYGGGYGFRLDTGSLAPLSGSNGPRKIRIVDFYADACNRGGVWIEWEGVGDRNGIEMSNISTRNIGQPVTEDGYPTSGVANNYSSIRITGNTSGDITRISINGARLEGWEGNTASCILVDYGVGVHVTNISFADHNAPSLGDTDIVTSNINQF